MNKVYIERRKHLADAMGEGVTILRTAPEQIRNRDAHHPYRFDSYFYYLSRFTEPDAILAITSKPSAKTILFCRDKDIEREIWDGFRYGPDGARESFEIDEAYSIAQADQILPKLLENQATLFYEVGADPGGRPSGATAPS